MTVVAIVVAVAVIGGLASWLAIRSSGDDSKIVSATGTQSPSPSAPSSSAPSEGPSTPAGGNSSTVFTLPQTAAGLTLQPNSGVADAFSKSLPSGGLIGKSTAGLYQSPGDTSKALLLFGAETKVAVSKSDVADIFRGFSSSSGAKFHRPKTYSAGSMGGAMECGEGTIAVLGTAAPASACVVGDKHGLIITLFTNKTAAAAASATRTLRPSFEHA